MEPQGHARSPHRIELTAQAGGILVGTVVDGAFRTWLAGSEGHLVLIVWPKGFRVRSGPGEFELLDEADRVVARGGEFVTVGGGHLVKKSDPRRLGHDDVFIASASQVSRAIPQT